jgi:hypothetical protein
MAERGADRCRDLVWKDARDTHGSEGIVLGEGWS